MNKENIRKWVNGLRSGEYAQTRGALYNSEERSAWINLSERENGNTPVNEGYCCLGVACEVAIKDGLNLKKESFGDYGRTGYGENEDDLFLPDEVLEWLGFDDKSPAVMVRDLDDVGMYELTELNDTYNLTFASIADIIEENFLRED